MSTPKNFLKVLVPGTDPKIDIIAVHGLNPKNKDDHAAKTWTHGEKLWLRDFLAPKHPEARILLFGYNSDVLRNTNTMQVDDHAANLLNRLEHKRRDDPDRAIVFVAHSLGGLVVKQALVEAKKNKRYDPIRTATHGIAFFATPHRGGNLASLGKILSDIVNKSTRNPPSKLIEALQEGSEFLDRLDANFRHQLEDYSFVSFFETQYYGPLNVIVDRKSAQLGLPGTREEILGMDRDHNDICKFATEDGDYEQVEGEIVRLIDGAITSAIQRGLLKTPSEQDTRRSSPSPFFNSPLLSWGPQSSSSSSSPAMNPNWFASSLGLARVDSQAESQIFEVPHNKSRNFVGRQDISQRLVDKLTSDEEHHRIALYGLGGVGKTDIAIQAAYAIKESFSDISVFWIQASSFENTHQSIMKIARALEIPGVEAPNADVFELLKHTLEKRERGRWVMIIDHADDSQSLTLPQGGKKLHKRIPDCLHGSVLLTTRNKKVAALFADKADQNGLEEVPPLSQKESQELMQQLLDTKQYQDGGVDELTKLLNHFPLAIVQAASFIRGNGITVETYLQRYSENKHDALEIFGHGHEWDDSEAVTTTWMISFKQLQANSQYAADLLAVMAFLDSSEIPESLLRGIDPSKTPLQFEGACGELKAFSFISETAIRTSTSSSANSTSLSKWFNIQPIVQLVMQQWLKKHNQATKWSDAALVAVSKALPSGEMSKEQWKAYEMYLPHVQTVLEYIDESTQEQQSRANLLHNVSWYFRVRGFHDTAAGMAREAITIRENVLGEEDEATLASIHSLSRILFEQGELKESEDLQVPAIEICKRKLGEEHKDTLRNQCHLAAIRGMQERYEEAFELQNKILDISTRTLGDCPETWLAMRDLAVTLSFMSRKHEAESLQKLVYDKRKECLGEDHPETLVIMSDLATTYIERSCFSEAEELLTNVLQHSRRILGDRHPHTVAAYEDLKEVLKSQGNTKHVRRLEEALRRVQREWKEKENAGARKRPNFKRSMSSSVITYSYRRPSTTVDDGDVGGRNRAGSEGVGLGLSLTRTTSTTLSEEGDEEDGDDEEEDDPEREEYAAIKKALVLTTRGVLTMPLINMIPVVRAEEAFTPITPIDRNPRSSLSTPHLTNADTPSTGVDPDVLSTRSRSATDATSITSGSDKPAYSANKFVRTLEKKVERNINKETYDKVVEINKQTYDRVADQSKVLLEETKTKWKKTNFKEFRKSWVPGKKERKDKEDGDGTVEAEEVAELEGDVGVMAELGPKEEIETKGEVEDEEGLKKD